MTKFASILTFETASFFLHPAQSEKFSAKRRKYLAPSADDPSRSAKFATPSEDFGSQSAEIPTSGTSLLAQSRKVSSFRIM